MKDGVAIRPDNSLIVGIYDGYGRLDNVTIQPNVESPDVYHLSCWGLAGKPVVYKGGSKSSKDQGWFFDRDRIHQMPNPIFKSKKTERAIPISKPSTMKAWDAEFHRMTKEDPAIGSLWTAASKAQSLKYRHEEKGRALFRRYSKREEAQVEMRKSREAEAEEQRLRTEAFVEGEKVLGPYRWDKGRKFLY
jgi:hypothetical protein